MPALLTYKSVMLLTRARLIALRRDIQVKLRRRGAMVTDLDHRMLFLAEHAIRMLGEGPSIPNVDAPQDLSTGISKFAVMGTAGPNLPGTGRILVDGHDWVRQTMHGGRPDPQRQRVVARTTDFVFKFWDQAKAQVVRSDLEPEGKQSANAAMRSFALGHLCHLATDIVTQPWIDDLEATLGRGILPRFSFGTPGKIDSRVAIQVLDRTAPRTDSPWTRWWPSPEDIPEPFYEAFAAAFREVYGATPTALEPDQLSNAFRTEIGGQTPPEMNADFVKDAYEFWYHGIVGVAYNYRYWDWALLFAPLLVTFALQLIAYPLLPKANDTFVRWPWDAPDGERASFELVTFALLSSGPAALTYGIAALALTKGSVRPETGFGFSSGLLLTLALAVFFGTLGTRDEDFHPVLRWVLLFAVPLVIPLVFFILALTNTERGVGGLQFVHALPFVMMMTTLLLYFVLFLPSGALASLAGAGTGGLIAIYVILAILTAAGLGVAWFFASKGVRDGFLPESPDVTFEERLREVPTSMLKTDRNMLVRLFDDSTLFHDPGLPAANVDALGLYFPTGHRPLIRLWWDGPGNVWVRSDRYQLVFANNANGDDLTVVVEAPIFPMRAAEYVTFLQGAGVSLSGVAGQLKAAVIDPADWDYELPAGATFSDHGDTEDTVEDHDRQARIFAQLGHVNDATAYVLYHAQPPALSARFGTAGAVVSGGRESLPNPGLGTIASDDIDVIGIGTSFEQLFLVGDRLRVGTQERVITRIESSTKLQVASEFSPAIAPGTAYERVGYDVEEREGFRFVSHIGHRVGGDTLMDRAADLSALLCMGMVPHLLDSGARTIAHPDLSARGGNAMAPVYQVFRNWNLDRRRVNEWRMLVQGGALSEKEGDSTAYDPAMTQPQPGGYRGRNYADGESAANELGWVPLLRRWAMDLASNADPLAATGTPTNLAVSRALAYLLDLPDPQRL